MKRGLLGAAVVGLALSFAAAGAHAQVKFGVAGPITGANAAFGAQLTNGTQMAIEDINASGGILGKKIELESGDDVSDPKQGVSVANKFVGDGVKFVIGHFNSGVTIPASEVYADSGVLFLTPSATNPGASSLIPWLCSEFTAISVVPARRCSQPPGVTRIACALPCRTRDDGCIGVE